MEEKQGQVGPWGRQDRPSMPYAPHLTVVPGAGVLTVVVNSVVRESPSFLRQVAAHFGV
jgi:hypothetical protein